ncbi:MAG: MBL fold metallo-hydrolase [Bacilli bacterium]|nr:MBL fold metallo-hydrolase [Bacilli bacterium]MDD4282329.1 MBL fold metallo-hydrolase [Bacilli bacterium]MDD4718333.1 MBL fold metallo-hydrolase [Bacilli bacterium]
MECVIIKVSILASGSKGNSTYISTETHKLLVDIGTSCLYTEKMLKSIEVKPSSIDSIFITHTHSDHINGLKVFCKKYNPTVYLTKKMHQEIITKFEIDNYVYIDNNLEIDDLNVSTIKTSHDSGESNGYIFESNEKTVVYITDTGYINKKYHKKLKNKNLYIIESNHDVEMLMNTNRPHHLKIRILGDEGHLSNNDASEYLSEFIGPKTKHIVLAHLSEEANSKTTAEKTLIEKLNGRHRELDSIIIADQNERTELIEI